MRMRAHQPHPRHPVLPKVGCRGDASPRQTANTPEAWPSGREKREGRQRNELETLTGTILHRQAPTPQPSPLVSPRRNHRPAQGTGPQDQPRQDRITAPGHHRAGAPVELPPLRRVHRSGVPRGMCLGAGTPRNGGAPPLAPGATPLVDGWGGPVAGMILPPPGAPDPCQQPQPIRSCGSCGEVARYELAHAAAERLLAPAVARTAVTLLPGARLHDLAPGGQKQLASWSGSVTGIILPPPGAPIQPQASPAPTAPALAQPSLGEVVHGALRAWPKPAGRTLAGPDARRPPRRASR